MKTCVSGIVIALALLMPFSSVAKPDFFNQNIGSLDCGINEIAKFNGAAWECSADLDALSQAIEEVGDLGCSATQQDNSVLIECGDGTAGVIAGAGTVVLYPEGQIGQVPPIDYNTGPIVAVDGSGVVLGEISNLDTVWRHDHNVPVIVAYDIYVSDFERGRLINKHDTQEVIFAGNSHQLFFLSEDCSGPAFMNMGLVELNNKFFIPDQSTVGGTILFKSSFTSGTWSSTWDSSLSRVDLSYVGPSECYTGDQVAYGMLAVEYFPAPEITNAVYPVRVEQLP